MGASVPGPGGGSHLSKVLKPFGETPSSTILATARGASARATAMAGTSFAIAMRATFKNV